MAERFADSIARKLRAEHHHAAADHVLSLADGNEMLVAEIERLRSLLVEANDAFDECAGDYSVELVHDEPWREFRSAEVPR